jgi:hypothetical protein
VARTDDEEGSGVTTFRMPDSWYEPPDEVDPDDSHIDERDDARWHDDPSPYDGTWSDHDGD